VHHAAGIVAARYRTSPADALLLLRAHAVAGDRRVLDVAEDVVAGADAFADSPLPVRGRER
jgi:AmiR/NasT family two-component response regulator